MQAALGLQRGLHVLSMMYEHNYEIALHAQSRYGDRIKSVIVPWPHITDGELDILTKSGVVGYRITWRLTKEIDQKMVARTTERGWSMHYLHRADEEQMDGWKPHILKTPGKFVLEHMGGVDPSKGIDGEGFKFVLQALDTGRCWVKLSPRISKQDDFPFSDTDPLVKKLVAARAEPPAVGLGLAASAILQADAERRRAARSGAGLGAGREDAQADLRRQSRRGVRLPAGVRLAMRRFSDQPAGLRCDPRGDGSRLCGRPAAQAGPPRTRSSVARRHIRAVR